MANLFILAVNGYPVSIGNAWALAEPVLAKKRPETGLPGDNQAEASGDGRTGLPEPLPRWVRKPWRVSQGRVAGVRLGAVGAVGGAGALALH